VAPVLEGLSAVLEHVFEPLMSGNTSKGTLIGTPLTATDASPAAPFGGTTPAAKLQRQPSYRASEGRIQSSMKRELISSTESLPPSCLDLQRLAQSTSSS